MAPDVKVWTVDDLADMPDDGQRYEVIDGELFVTPSPALRHQEAILELALRLAPYVALHGVGRVIVAPADVRFSSHRGVQPDLFVLPLVDGRRPRELSDIRELLLAVEILSPSSARADRMAKRAMYRDEGVSEYWVVDLDARTFERSTPVDARVDVVSDAVEWHPVGASAPLIIDLERYFADALDG